MKYGLTKVFLQHKYYAELRIKILKKEGDKTFLYSYLGDSVELVKQYKTDKKQYKIPPNFFNCVLDESFTYFYEFGEYSFFRYKYIKHEGSSRSSKSFSIEEHIVQRCEENKGYRATIWRDTKESLAQTIWKDFRKIFPASGRNHKFPQNMTAIPINGGSIEPHGDDSTNAHGLTQNLAWLNEPYRMKEDTFHQIDMRCEQLFIDMNPTGKHWSDFLDKHPRCKVIYSTFQDNPFCPIEMRLKILSYDPSNPVNVANGTANEWKWQVYGLGLKAEKPDRIYHWNKIKRSEYDAIDCNVMYCVDWGKVDPFSIVELKLYDQTVYVRELNYLSENEIRANATPLELSQMSYKVSAHEDEQNNEDTGVVLWLFNKLGLSKKSWMVADNNRPLKIASAKRSGWEYIMPTLKVGKKIDSISMVQNIRVCYTDDSPNIEYEHENYSWKVDRYGVTLEEPEEKDDHHMDSIRYGIMKLISAGLIKNNV